MLQNNDCDMRGKKGNYGKNKINNYNLKKYTDMRTLRVCKFITIFIQLQAIFNLNF